MIEVTQGAGESVFYIIIEFIGEGDFWRQQQCGTPCLQAFHGKLKIDGGFTASGDPKEKVGAGTFMLKAFIQRFFKGGVDLLLGWCEGKSLAYRGRWRDDGFINT